MSFDYDKVCDFCHTPVSIFESLTEFGKHYHEQCYIHRTQKEIEGYKKKWLNKAMTLGDKADLVDKYNLVQKLMVERTQFRGFVPIEEVRRETPKLMEKTAVCISGSHVLVDNTGFPILIESKTSSVSVTTLRTRPEVLKIKTGHKPKLLTVQDIPLLMESLP